MKSREGASLAGLSLWELLCILAHDILPNPSLQKKSGKTVSIKSETILSLGIWFQKKLYGLFESLRNFKEIVRVYGQMVQSKWKKNI